MTLAHLIEENVVSPPAVRNRTNESELRRIISDRWIHPRPARYLYRSYSLK